MLGPVLSLLACSDPDSLQSPTNCSGELSYLDQLEQLDQPNALSDWIQKSLEEGASPGLSIEVDVESMNRGVYGVSSFETVEPLAGIDRVETLFFLADQWEHPTQAYFKRDRSGWVFNPTETMSCEQGYAYRVQPSLSQFDEPLGTPLDMTITGNCEVEPLDTGETDTAQSITDELHCNGTFYTNCPIDTNNPLGPYDCKVYGTYHEVNIEAFPY